MTNPDQNSFERLDSRQKFADGHNVRGVRRVFQVLGVHPDNAIRLANPPFPAIGTYLEDAFADQDNWGYPYHVQLRGFTVGFLPNSDSDSLVVLHYDSGPDISETSIGVRRVTWEQDVVSADETVYVAIDGRPIPGGASRSISIVQMRGTMNGGNITIPMQYANVVNTSPFRSWGPGKCLYTGATSELIHGTDTFGFPPIFTLGAGNIVLSFLARDRGWTDRKIVHDDDGFVVFNEEGPVYDEYPLYPSIEFDTLFPAGWDYI